MIFSHHVNQIIQLVQSLSRQCRNIGNLRIRHIGKDFPDLGFILFYCLIILFNGIPLIDGNDDCLSPLMGNSGDLGVLLRDTLHGINQKHHNIGTLHGTYRTHDHIAFQIFLYLILAPQSRSIDENILLAVVGNRSINGIPCGACHIGDDQSVFTEHFIDQRRFSNVRLTNNGHTNLIIFFLFLTLLTEMCNHLIQHISKSHLIGCGNGMRISNAEVIKLIHICHIFIYIIYLVHCKYHGFL